MNNNYESKMGSEKKTSRHALVIGGSLAGLFAARVLDRDVFPVKPDHRKGVPQSYHAHGLLPTGFRILTFDGPLN